ncbi:methyltransferase domain-containing protein [Mesorhizobium sp. M1143]
MLSIGCGYGDLERHFMRIDASIMCDAFDIAPAAIQGAILAARQEGFTGIQYRCADIETAGLEQGVYDAAWFNGSLHHIQALERVLERVHNSLKPGGLLFVNEYVGANHFGFPPAQREAISHAFHLIPHQYRRSFIPANLGQVATQAPIPDPAEVRRVDPSEAIRSQDIVSAIADNFDIIAINACGGTIMQFLLSGIAGNFREDDASSMLVLDIGRSCLERLGVRDRTGCEHTATVFATQRYGMHRDSVAGTYLGAAQRRYRQGFRSTKREGQGRPQPNFKTGAQYRCSRELEADRPTTVASREPTTGSDQEIPSARLPTTAVFGKTDGINTQHPPMFAGVYSTHIRRKEKR